jgi:hypothetical protein
MTGGYTIVGLGRREEALRRLQERLLVRPEVASFGVN